MITRKDGSNISDKMFSFIENEGRKEPNKHTENQRKKERNKKKKEKGKEEKRKKRYEKMRQYHSHRFNNGFRKINKHFNFKSFNLYPLTS